MAKAWQSRPARGSVVGLAEVLALAAGPDPGTSPRVSRAGGRVFVHYSRPRLYLDRNAWEALIRPDDVLVQRIRPEDRGAFTIALTRGELERVFGDVRSTRSWDDVRCYHFPKLPPAVDSFRVHGAEPRHDATAAARRPVGTAVRRAGPTPRTPAGKAGPMPVAATGGVNAWAEAWAERLGARAESSAYLHSVGAWRDVWRPQTVRVLLVAESHVAEEPGDTDVRVVLPSRQPSPLPTSYCRLVYCLGYGEDGLCTPRPERNSGTWQFWDIFGAIAGGAVPAQPRKATSSLIDRLRWKTEVLRWLRDQGVWLVDACVAGVYQPGGGRAVAGADYDRMVRESFERFVWPTVAGEPIEQLWVIGAGVARALGGTPGMTGARTIVQPQGDRGDPGRHRRELNELVAAVRPLVSSRR